MESRDCRAAHLIIGAKGVDFGIGLILGEPRRKRRRLLLGACIDPKHIGRTFVPRNRVGERDCGRDELAGTLGGLTDGEGRARIDRAGEELHLVHLEELVGLLHRDGRVGFFILIDELNLAAHDTAAAFTSFVARSSPSAPADQSVS